MTVFADAVALLHADPDLSLPARYQPGGVGPWTALRVIRAVEDATASPFARELKTRSDTFQLQVADVPQAGINDVLELLDTDDNPTERLVVTAARLDIEGITWTITGTRRM